MNKILTSEFISLTTFQEILSKIVENKKIQNPSFSASQMSLKVGAKSRGYILEVINGNRSFARSKLSLLANFLQLNQTELQYLDLILCLEKEKKQEARVSLETQLLHLKNQLFNPIVKLSTEIENNILALQILAFFKISSKTSRQELQTFFKNSNIHAALMHLEKQNFIQITGDEIQCLDTQHFNLKYENSDDAGTNKLIAQALLECSENAEKIYLNPQECIIGNSTISCEQKNLKASLSEIKGKIDTAILNTQTQDPNTLVELCLAIYTVGTKSKTI